MVISHKFVLGALFATTALVLAPAASLSAHETGAIHVSANQVASGGAIGVRGERLPKASDLKLELRGVLDNYPVGSVKTDTAGAFQMQLTIPQKVPAGAYTLVVIASDGDVTARADLAITAAPPTTTAAAGSAQPSAMAGMPGMSAGDHGVAGMSGEQATAKVMSLSHTTTPAEWVVIWGIIVLSFGSGTLLLRRAAVEEQPVA